MSTTKKNLLLLYDHPKESILSTRGPENVQFDVPNSYLNDEYKNISVQIANKFGEDASEKVTVNEISLPPFGEILSFPRDENFSLFIPRHRRLAGKLIDIFLGMRDVDELLSVAVFAREHVNPLLFNYAFSVALLHRPDTQDLDVPSVIQSFPDKYVDSKVFGRAREIATTIPETSRVPIEVPKDYTASDLEIEHRLAYFREDIGVNLHHWHWHLVYPIEGPLQIVDKNRRGELFYYMHQQIIARYNFERFCNQMKRVERFLDFDEPIKEAYFPKLDSLVASRNWPARVANQRLQNLRREVDQIYLDIDEMKRWRDRIFDAIHSGVVKGENRNDIILTENEGIDILGNLLESTILSVNRAYYGDLHNMGHTIVSYIHDPDARHLESFGVIGDSTTSMRDPWFYCWHAYMDDIFQNFKSTLPRYTVEQLDYPGITVESVQVETEGSPDNVFETFWQQSDVDLSRGMDFQPRGAILVRFTHLQHTNFSYKITVNNQTTENREGTCRIFLAPKYDERGNPWLFRDQKTMFIELDKFKVTLWKGSNTIFRRSIESSVTIPFEKTFRNVDAGRPAGGNALDQFNFCGCGWPQHMLLPKGSISPFECQLFVMISDYAGDKIEQSIEGQCNDAGSYCGIKDKLYPDRRSMGYPFDRQPRNGVDTLQQFLTPNMRVQDVSIRFSNRTEPPKARN
ncbi:phenoloxidase 1 isoform X2 [Leptinotarsa decemlineata]